MMAAVLLAHDRGASDEFIATEANNATMPTSS
jgi:hypothetical protein